MDAQLKEAVALAAEISKQLMTLSTGILAVTVTVATNFSKRISVGQLWLLIPSWLSYLFTIIFAMWHLSALTGNLLARPIDLSLSSARLPALLEVFGFGLGTLFVVLFAIWMGIDAALAQARNNRMTKNAPL
jgi:hypothetical protein